MFGVIVTFDYAGDFDRARVVKIAENARGTFEGMPGLHFKFFTVTRTAGGRSTSTPGTQRRQPGASSPSRCGNG